MPTASGLTPESEQFGCQIPGAEPYWYQGYHSAFYTESHKNFRALVRKFTEERIKPNVEEWIEKGAYPTSLHIDAYNAGIGGVFYPKAFGGTPPEGFDAFHELILWDELGRVGGGAVLGQLAINSMALPPILTAGSQYLKDLVARDVITGKKQICLAISEPTAGSDVANIRTTAVRDGDFYIVNGSKKWITGGNMGDYFTTAVRTGEDGMGGLSLLLLERGMPGIKIRKMKTQFDSTHGTTFINLEDVKVPVRNLIGKEGAAFKYIVHNFNHERFVIACGATRGARLCYEEAFKEALQRKTFGKRLVQHQLIRFKLAEMSRQIEALHDNLERVAYQFKMGVRDVEMGGQCALLKVNGSKVFEYCAREASQIFGGSSVVREGRGQLVERMYREVRASAIPGGSEEILLDFNIRQAIGKVMAQMGQSKL